MVNARGIIKTSKKVVRTIVAVNALYCLTLFACDFIPSLLSEKIESQEKLEQLVEIERDKLDQNSSLVIEARLLPNWQARAGVYPNGEYAIEIGSHRANISTLRHEMYHILDGHCDSNAGIQSDILQALYYFYVTEPQAIIYAMTGIKI